MSGKRYGETINPQLAVQDYLNDLLQQMPTTSVLDELKTADDKKKAMAVEALAKATLEKRAKTRKQSQKPIVQSSMRPEHRHASISSYSAVAEKSLASKRLEKKRALARSSQKEFRDPLILKTAPVLNRVFKTAPPPELTITTESTTTSESTTATEKRHNERSFNARADKELTTDKPAIIVTGNTGGLKEKPEPIKHWLTSGKPEWAQGRFECLIFTVAGLKLAVPLVSLGAIHTMDKELTPLVGRPPWFLGLLTVGERNVRVVDSAKWIMPERYTERVKDNYKFVIRLNDSEWGMACDSVAQSFTLAPEEVRWRTDRGKRPWLAGTVIEHMCALMDVAAVSWLLDDAEKNKLSPI
jgi:purine-binding chemotaxis protein CheW